MDTNQSPRPARSLKVEMARRMRRNPTPAEHTLWQYLRANRLDGHHFRRQHPIAGFVVDFYCHALKLAVEVDGPIHDARAGCDRQREGLIRAYGVSIVRVRNETVLRDPAAALAAIRRAITGVRDRRAPSPS